SCFVSLLSFCSLIIRSTPIFLLFPYTTLFRSSKESLTSEAGFYRFVAVEPGDYSVEFHLAGFEKRKIDSVTVTTAQEVVVTVTRSEEHTSELQSPDHLVCRLLLEKKKKSIVFD